MALSTFAKKSLTPISERLSVDTPSASQADTMPAPAKVDTCHAPVDPPCECRDDPILLALTVSDTIDFSSSCGPGLGSVARLAASLATPRGWDIGSGDDSMMFRTPAIDAMAMAPRLADAADGLTRLYNVLQRGMQKTADTTDMAVNLVAEATALGTDTNADGSLYARLIDKGAVTIAYGAASFQASAESSGGEFAFATAMTDVVVTGADVLITWTNDREVTLEAGGSTFMQATSITHFLALDFERWDFRHGPIVIDGDRDQLLFAEFDWLPNLVADGNLTVFDFDVEARAVDTYADVAFSVLSLEDQISSISASAILA